MKHFYPGFYDEFKCIAADCPDSCCKGWDVVVDDESEAYYNTVNTDFGKKIKDVTVTDEDGDRIFTLQNGQCPFWNEDKLCDIYINLGENRLCKTCRMFPRIIQDYGTFAEHTLSLACPEAVRLVLESNTSGYNSFSETRELNDDEYDKEIMELLLNGRQSTINILTENKSFISKLIKALEYNINVQDKIDASVDWYEKTDDLSFIIGEHEKLDYVDKNFKSAINGITLKAHDSTLDSVMTKLAVYYVYRYYLNAISSYYVLSTLKRVVCAYIVINSLTEYYDINTAVQQYSKEVEHSYENTEYLDELFENDERFGVMNLIENLRESEAEELTENQS